MPFATPAKWWAWLEAHHSASPGVRLRIAKKGAGAASVTYQEALDAALCWGWIDGQKGRHDDDWWIQRFTPRGPRSGWSKLNCQKAEALIEAGRMTPSGLAEVERAKRDGRWAAAYDSQSRAAVPPDLAHALAAIPQAAAFFDALESHNRYAILYRVQTAKKVETRAVRIQKFVEMLSRGETIHPTRRQIGSRAVKGRERVRLGQ